MPNCVLCDKELGRSQRRYCSDVCVRRGDTEAQRVSNAKQASERNSLPATLTPDEWLTHLHYFNWMCAYCQKRQATSIDHVIPPGYGGGTTADNCVPCCGKCNCAKSDHHPNYMPFYPEPRIPAEAMAKVQAYLQNFSSPPTLDNSPLIG